MKIIFFSTQPFEREVFDRENSHHQHEMVYISGHLELSNVGCIPEGSVVCCFVNDNLDAKVLEALVHRGVLMVALRSAGFNHVDCVALQHLKLPVCHVPAYSPEAVAEYAVGLILSLNRKINRAYYRVREGDFSLQGLMGFNLYQKTVGIVGTGRIGVALSRILKGFGCHLLAYDPLPSDVCRSLGVQYVDFKTLLSTSDIISLHCPLTENTQHLIDTEALSHMKQGVMLINTSRGGLIHSKAVINALKTKKIGYLGLDVYEEEGPLFFENHSDDIIKDDLFCRLLTFPNVIITGHQGFFTKEAVDEIAKTTLENITNFEKKLGSVHWIPTASDCR